MIPRLLRMASISAMSSSTGAAGWPLAAGLRRADSAGRAATAFVPAVPVTAGALAGARRARAPPTTQSTMHRPSSESPNQTAGEKMIRDAQPPRATTPFHSSAAGR